MKNNKNNAKNNAVEKVEKIAEKNKKSSGAKNYEKTDMSAVEKSAFLNGESAKQSEKGNDVQSERAFFRADEKNSYGNKNEELRAQEKRLAEKRVELAKLKALKKAEKKERQAAEKKEREKLKREKTLEKKERKKEKQKNKTKKSGGYIAAIITLGISTLVLASALTFTFLMPTESDTALESSYKRSFYNVVDGVDNMDTNMSKILATKDEGAMQIYLLDLAVNSEVTENDLQSLPFKDESKFYTTKLVNQIGDYAKYLNKKLAEGKPLTTEDKAGLLALYQNNQTLKNTLNSMIEKMGQDFSFSSIGETDDGNIVVADFNELENLSVEYPELIYDGPFSDGITDRKIKGLDEEEVSLSYAKDRFIALFGELGLENVTEDGETATGIETYNFSAIVKGEPLFAQISKRGGKLVMFDYGGSCKEVNYEQQPAIDRAEEFMKKAGITGMKAVWVNLNNNLYTINFAFDLNGVIVYSDLVKVRVCAETGNVIGMEASSYYYNHTERILEQPVLTKNEAQERVSDNIEVETSRLSVVPVGNESEKLCYEFSGSYDGALYYVYIDAISGKQVQLFKVIESTEGTLLI